MAGWRPKGFYNGITLSSAMLKSRCPVYGFSYTTYTHIVKELLYSTLVWKIPVISEKDVYNSCQGNLQWIIINIIKMLNQCYPTDCYISTTITLEIYSQINNFIFSKYLQTRWFGLLNLYRVI